MDSLDRLHKEAADYLLLARDAEQPEMKALLIGMAEACNALAGSEEKLQRIVSKMSA
jgi:hypothetical protein